MAAMRWLLVAVIVVGAMAPPAFAVEADDPARPLALKVLNPAGLPSMPLQIIASAEPSLVETLRAAGMSAPDAHEAAEQFIMPELRRRSRELERLIEDVFIETFTPEELVGIADPEQTPGRRSAAAKFPAVTARISRVAGTWMDGVRREVIAVNNDRFKVQTPLISRPLLIR